MFYEYGDYNSRTYEYCAGDQYRDSTIIGFLSENTWSPYYTKGSTLVKEVKAHLDNGNELIIRAMKMYM